MRRAARSLAKALGYGAVFASALAGGVIAHMDVPVVRRAVVARVNEVLASVVAGRIVIDHIDSVGLSHVSGVNAHVEDPDGHAVIRVSALDARISTRTLVQSLLGGGDVVVDIDALSVGQADVSLDAGDGTLRLARAFGPRNPSAPSSGGRGVRLAIPHAFLGHAVAHGQPPGAPPIDADVDGADVAVSVVPGALAVDVRHAGIAARNLPAEATTRGTLDGRLALPAPQGEGLFAHATWSGTIGELAATADATYDAGRVDAVVDVPATRPECVRGLWAACPFGETTSARAEVHGALPQLHVNAQATVGKGSVTLAGPVSVDEEVHAALHLTATAIDLHALTPSAPSSELSASGDAMLVSTADGAAGAVLSLELAPGTIAGTSIPAATAVGRFGADAKAGIHAEANVAVHEPGAPATATLRLSPHGDSFQVDFDASTAIPRLDGIPRVGPLARGSAQARARGTFDLGAHRIDARVNASAESVEAGGVRLGNGALAAHVSGPVAAPWIDADLTGSGLAAGSLLFDTLHAEVHGPPTRAPVKVSLHGHGADFFARADVELQGGATLRDLVVAVERDGESARAQAALVRVTSRETSVGALDVEGLGAPLHAELHVAPGSARILARSHGLDLARLGRLAGAPHVGGRVALDVDAELRPSSAEGHIVVDLTQGSIAGWKDATAHLDAALAGRRASGHFKASVADIGSAEMTSTSVELGAGDPLEASTWRSAWGAADVAAHVDLAKLVAHLPKDTFAAARVSGTVDVKGRVERDSASDTTPDVDVTASTHDLTLTGNPIPWRVEGLGAKLHVRVDGKTGRTALDAQLGDHGGGLLALEASSDAVPYRQVFEVGAPLGDALLAMPFQASVTLPARDVATLPALLGTHGMSGMLEGRIDWRGAARQPTVDLHATLAQGKADIAILALPVDLGLTGHYDGAHGEASVTATSRGQKVLDASAAVDVRAADLVGDGELPWTASAHAKLSDFPLQSVAALDNRQVRGRASGSLTLEGLHRDAHASLALAFDQLQVGDIACLPTTLNATADGHTIELSSRIAEQDGYAEAKAHLGARWGSALVPAPDASQAAQLALTAKHFRAAVLLPFVSTIFTELDGRIDANARVEIDPVARTMKPAGTLSLTEGVFEVSAFGSELHDAAAKVTLTPDGVVKLEGFRAKGLSGRVEAAATARFQGFDLTGARASVQVPKKEPLPLVVDGVQIGMFDGRLDLAVDRAKDALDVSIDVPTMRLQLPEAATHEVQALGSLPGVRVGIARGRTEFAPIDLDGSDVESAAPTGPVSPMRVAVHLGSDVEVKRGTDLDVRLEGGPTVTVAQNVTAKGQIRLSHGSLNVEGKTFQIDNGTVTFVDDPTNPQIVLTASWASPDGTTIYADFVGPLKTGKVTLRSEPALGQNEILALLLYGTTDQQGSATSGAAGSPQLGAAGGVAGNAASEKINRALGGVNQALDSIGLTGGISTKLDTSQTTPRPEVEVQIARDISLQVAWVLGVPPPGSNPDTHLFTLNWRFLRQWSLQTTVGDAGTSILDLVWQHRY